jgi:hypothetical protein
MGHRSWFYEIKSPEDLEETMEFVNKALDICDYSCIARLECFFALGSKLYVGWASDGSTAGETFKKKVRKKGHVFGLLGEHRDQRIEPGYLYRNNCYLQPEDALKRLGLELSESELAEWMKRLEDCCSEDLKEQEQKDIMLQGDS